MTVGSVAVCFKEERFVGKHLDHLPDWIDEKLVLCSQTPWQGEPVEGDNTANIARVHKATVLEWSWDTEEDQRNAGQDWHNDKDWVIVMDPDEFLPEGAWMDLYEYLKRPKHTHDAYVCRDQRTYWKTGLKVDPPEDYKQIIAVRPNVRFIDKRVVDSSWGHAPVTLHHFAWARTDEEVWNKITHYAHANEFDTKDWYDNIWSSDKTTNLHPLTPEALKQVVPAQLPPSLDKLGLWPR